MKIKDTVHVLSNVFLDTKIIYSNERTVTGEVSDNERELPVHLSSNPPPKKKKKSYESNAIATDLNRASYISSKITE